MSVLRWSANANAAYFKFYGIRRIFSMEWYFTMPDSWDRL